MYSSVNQSSVACQGAILWCCEPPPLTSLDFRRLHQKRLTSCEMQVQTVTTTSIEGNVGNLEGSAALFQSRSMTSVCSNLACGEVHGFNMSEHDQILKPFSGIRTSIIIGHVSIHTSAYRRMYYTRRTRRISVELEHFQKPTWQR